jgi:hypothetical protein
VAGVRHHQVGIPIEAEEGESEPRALENTSVVEHPRLGRAIAREEDVQRSEPQREKQTPAERVDRDAAPSGVA